MQAGEGDDMSMDSDNLKHFMITVPSMVAGQQTTTSVATETPCSIIPIQALANAAVAIDTSQGVVTVGMTSSPTMVTQQPLMSSIPQSSVNMAAQNVPILTMALPTTVHHGSDQDVGLPSNKESETKSSENSSSEVDPAASSSISDIRAVQLDYGSEGQRSSDAINKDLNKVNNEKNEMSQISSASETSRQGNLQAVISHLISTQSAAMVKEEDMMAEKTKPYTGGRKDVHKKGSRSKQGQAIPNVPTPILGNMAHSTPTTRTSPNGSQQTSPKQSNRRSRGSSSKSESGSSSDNTSPSARSRSASKQAVNGNSGYGQVGYEKLGGLFYDYSLPDRGLGTAGMPTKLSPTQQSPKAVGMVTTPGWPYPQSPNLLPVPSPTLSERSRTSPLDLSAQPSKEGAKQTETATKGVKNNSKNHSAKVPPTATLSDSKGKEGPVVETNDQVIETASQKEQKKNPVAHYDRNILIFGEKAVEIISVGNNKWIVRNEDELCNIATGEVVKKNTDGSESSLAGEVNFHCPPVLSPQAQVKRLSEGQRECSDISSQKVPKTNNCDVKSDSHPVLDSGATEKNPPDVVFVDSDVMATGKMATESHGSDLSSSKNSKNCPVLEKMLKPK